MLNAKLTVVGGAAKAAEINLKLPTTIGRGRDATLTLPHPLVSRKHCEIFERDGKLYVRDLKSLNGTFIDSERIDGIAELSPEQLLTIGTVTFRAQYQPCVANKVPGSKADALAAESSHVLEMDEQASSDSDSKLSFNGKQADELAEPLADKAATEKADLQEKKTTPGKQRLPKSRKPATPVKVPMPAPTSDVLDEIDEPSADRAEHSVVAAMRRSAGAGARHDLSGTMDELRKLLPELQSPAMASSIEGLDPGEKRVPGVVDDFSGISSEETIRVKVDANDSNLGSFIRKMPR
jgi:predicted component of type VI protein secretion system